MVGVRATPLEGPLNWTAWKDRRFSAETARGETVTAPDPGTLGLDKQTGMPPENDVAFFYFRTTLNAPKSIRLRSVHLVFGHVDDSERVIVNGREVRDVPAWSYDVPIGRYLHRGRNSGVVLIGDWSEEATLQGARFRAATMDGSAVDAGM